MEIRMEQKVRRKGKQNGKAKTSETEREVEHGNKQNGNMERGNMQYKIHVVWTMDHGGGER